MPAIDIADCINETCPWSGKPVQADSLTEYDSLSQALPASERGGALVKVDHRIPVGAGKGERCREPVKSHGLNFSRRCAPPHGP